MTTKYIHVYLKQGCGACRATKEALHKLPPKLLARVMVQDHTLIPPRGTNNIGPDRVPVIMVGTEGSDILTVHQGSWSTRDFEHVLGAS